jgi:cell division protein FtsB
LSARLISLLLATLLVLVQAELWFGNSGMPRVMQLRAKLKAQNEANDSARRRNEQLLAEVLDLREGLEMVEEKARYELGMVKPDEILVQIALPQR